MLVEVIAATVLLAIAKVGCSHFMTARTRTSGWSHEYLQVIPGRSDDEIRREPF